MKEKILIYEFLKNTMSEKLIHVDKAEILMENKEINEIMFNGYNNIYCEINQVIVEQHNIFESREEYHRFVSKLLSQNNITINESKPIADFNIGKNLRVNIVKDSISHRDLVMSVRRRKEEIINIKALIDQNFATDEVLYFLKAQMKNMKNIFISGETSTGKTTLLNAMLKELSPEERIITIEDTKEIELPPHFNSINLVARDQLYDSKEVNISDLIKASLRMRPDRIILGEIRREEVMQYIHALNTGHRGSICTGHSQSSQDMLNRLTMLLLEQNIPLEAIKLQLGRSIDLIAHLTRSKNKRKISSIDSVSFQNNEICIENIVYYDEVNDEYIWKNNF